MFKPNKKGEDHPRERQMDDPGPIRRPRAFTNISPEHPDHVQKGDIGSSRRERLFTEESKERLRQIQLMRLGSNFILILAHCNAKHDFLQDDLGSARRERVSTEDDPRNNSNVRLEDLEARRQSNIPGTEMFKRANKERSALAAWASVRDDSQDTRYEELEDLNGGQSHRAGLNARFDSIRDIPAKRACANPKANFQPAHSRRFSSIAAPRANPVVNADSRTRATPADSTRAGRGQIIKNPPRGSASLDRGGGVTGSRTRVSGPVATRGHGASRSRDYSTPVRAQQDFSRKITSPDVFMALLRDRRHAAESLSAPVLTPSQRPQRASQSEAPAHATVSSSPATVAAFNVTRQSASPLRTPRATARTAAQQPIVNTTSEHPHPSTTPRDAPRIVPQSGSPQPFVDTLSRSTFAESGPTNLLLDLAEPARCQDVAATSDYSQLQGLNFGGVPMLDWSVSFRPVSQQQTPVDPSFAMRAQVHEHNSRRDNCPPVITKFGSNNPFAEFTPFVNSTPATGHNPFTDPPLTSSTGNNPFRTDSSSVISRSADYDSFRDYRSPGDPPSSGESKLSTSGAPPTPSLLSPKKTKGSDFTPSFEKLCVSGSPTRKPASIPKPLGTLAHSEHAVSWLNHHAIRKAKVIGVKASLDAKHREAHVSVYEHPVQLQLKPKALGPSLGSSVTSSQRSLTRNGQQIAGNYQSPQRATVRVLGPAPGPLSVRSQRQDDLNLASHAATGSQQRDTSNISVLGPAPAQSSSRSQGHMTENRNSSTGNPNPGTSDSRSTATDSQGRNGPKPKVLGIQPYNPRNKKGKL
ncbi:uncharacterized protein N7498_010021 [Penicillium cinerascens]|uniref:Ataxin-2 C-terminal domain-containing protein n=1 Tax=Penicillium cinerascens TaxID=70096 RepID=A0A9W9M610_9EURO|nr:uncharacterized protein N7498_010021 [Penicillium cinerascens]KAJ5191036.1 hypothetical protein N7498_010021 [Penicillium cinerascens]